MPGGRGAFPVRVSRTVKGSRKHQIMEHVRTWQTRPPGVLDDKTIVNVGEVWRCTICSLYFQNKTQATEHEQSNHKEINHGK